MPFESQAQRGFMYAKKPALAKEFEKETPKGKKLPYHVKKMSKKPKKGPFKQHEKTTKINTKKSDNGSNATAAVSMGSGNGSAY